MHKIYLLIIGIIAFVPIHAQSDYADFLLDSLCSDEFAGRGYVQNGDLKAAKFIRNQFKSLGIKQYQNRSYFQEFDIAINTFPDTINIEINGEKLRAGIDYLVDGASGAQKGSFKCISIKKKQLLNINKFMKEVAKDKLKNVFLVVYKDEFKTKTEKELYHNTLMTIKQYEGFELAGIIQITNEKLTWVPSTKYTGIPILILNAKTISYPIEEINIHLNQKFHDVYFTQNVIGHIEGSHYPDSFIYITAHYDHLGKMGSKTIFRGANDNASGVAMMLSLAKHYSKHPPKYSILFVAFAAEEIGLLGSNHFTKYPFIPHENIKLVLNFDLLGTGQEGIAIVNGAQYLKDIQTINYFNDLNQYVSKIKVRANAANSDHYYFSKKGIKSFFIYTMGGTKAYHDIYDNPESLPFTKFNNVMNLMINYLNFTQKMIY